MQFLMIFFVALGGAGLSVEAGLLGPLGAEVGELWATFSIFGVGAALTFILMLFFSPRNSPYRDTSNWDCYDNDRYFSGPSCEEFAD